MNWEGTQTESKIDQKNTDLLDESDRSLYNKVLEDIQVKDKNSTQDWRSLKRNMMPKLFKKQKKPKEEYHKPQRKAPSNVERVLVGRLEDKKQFKEKVFQNRRIISSKRGIKLTNQRKQSHGLHPEDRKKNQLQDKRQSRGVKKRRAKQEMMENFQDHSDNLKNVMGQFSKRGSKQTGYQNRAADNSCRPGNNLIESLDFKMSELVPSGYVSQGVSARDIQIQQEGQRVIRKVKRNRPKMKQIQTASRLANQLEFFSREPSVNSDVYTDDQKLDTPAHSKPSLFYSKYISQ